MSHENHDLGHDYFLNLYEDGSADVRNCNLGIVLRMPKESVDRLRRIFKEVRIDLK